MGVKMTKNCDYDSVVGVILPVENRIPIANCTPQIEIDKNTPLFYTVCQKHSQLFLLVVKMAAPPQFISPSHTIL